MKVMDVRNKVLGPDHRDTLISMVHLSRTYSDQRKYEDAEALQMKVLDVRKKVLGPDHPNTLTCMANLARTFADQGKHEQAQNLHMEMSSSGNLAKLAN